MPRAGSARAASAARARRTRPRPRRERPTPRPGWRTGGPSVELAPGDLDATVALELARSADERGGDPPREPHHDRAQHGGPEAAHRESGDEPGDEVERDPVHDQNE